MGPVLMSSTGSPDPCASYANSTWLTFTVSMVSSSSRVVAAGAARMSPCQVLARLRATYP